MPKKPKTKDDAPSPSVLSRYMADVGSHPLLTAAEEAALAFEIRDARAGLWRAVLSIEPLVGPAWLAFGGYGAERGSVDALAETLVDADRDADVSGPLLKALADLRSGSSRALRAIDWVDEDAALDLAAYARKQPRAFGRKVDAIEQADQELRRLKQRFAQANLRLVIKIASAAPFRAYPQADIVQEGNLGLLKAVDRFDPRKGYRFSTYATWWIQHAIRRSIDNTQRTVRVPAHSAAKYYKVGRIERELERELGREPTVAEIAEKWGKPIKEVRRAQRTSLDPAVTIDPLTGGVPGANPNSTGITLVDDRPLVEETLHTKSVRRLTTELLSRLTPIERDVVERRFGLVQNCNGEHKGQTLKEIARPYSLSRERIRQIEDAALTKLRRYMAHKGAYTAV